MPRLQGYRERLWWKYYDTLDLAADLARVKFFSSRNVGDFMRTNLQMGGQISGDQSFVILSFYALCPIDDRCAKVMMEFVIGSKTMLPTMTLKDWLLGFRPLRPMVIPVRQNFYAEADKRVDLGPEFETSVHFEGLLTRDVA